MSRDLRVAIIAAVYALAIVGTARLLLESHG